MERLDVKQFNGCNEEGETPELFKNVILKNETNKLRVYTIEEEFDLLVIQNSKIVFVEFPSEKKNHSQLSNCLLYIPK